MNGPNYETSSWSKINCSFERVKRVQIKQMSLSVESEHSFSRIVCCFLCILQQFHYTAGKSTSWKSIREEAGEFCML